MVDECEVGQFWETVGYMAGTVASGTGCGPQFKGLLLSSHGLLPDEIVLRVTMASDFSEARNL